MYKKSGLMSIKVITPLRAGGENNISIIDSPIQREGHTGYPKIEASTLKGCVRNAFEKNSKKVIKEETINAIFGCEKSNQITASSVAFSDARILFFPVRSVKGVFAYITCPYVLQRFSNDIIMTSNQITLPSFSDLKTDKCLIPKGKSKISFSAKTVNNDIVVLDEFAFDACESQDLADYIENVIKLLHIEVDIEKFINQVVVIPDDNFTDFVINATEIITRIKIKNETGVVEEGALFNEEYIPSESILYSLVFVSDEHKVGPAMSSSDIVKAMEDSMPEYIQIGANMTLGKGFTQCKMNLDGDVYE